MAPSCPRCGVGHDTDGDGNCAFCHNIPDDRLTAAIIQANACKRPTFPQAFRREAKIQLTSKSHWWELGSFAGYIAIGMIAGMIMRWFSTRGDTLLAVKSFILLCTIMLRPVRRWVWQHTIERPKL